MLTGGNSPMAEAKDLKSFQCGFESRFPYQLAANNFQHGARRHPAAPFGREVRLARTLPSRGRNIQMHPGHIVHEKRKETRTCNGACPLASVVTVLKIGISASRQILVLLRNW